MEPNKDEIASTDEKPDAMPLGNLNGVVGTIAGCAFMTFFMGAVFGAPWPGAVASCGLSVMGVGVAYVMLRRQS